MASLKGFVLGCNKRKRPALRALRGTPFTPAALPRPSRAPAQSSFFACFPSFAPFPSIPRSSTSNTSVERGGMRGG